MPGLEVNLPTSERNRIWFLWSDQAISILGPVISATLSKHNLIRAHIQSPQALAKLLTRPMHMEAMITDHMWSDIQKYTTHTNASSLLREVTSIPSLIEISSKPQKASVTITTIIRPKSA